MTAELTMPAAPGGLAVGTRQLELGAVDLPPVGSVFPGRLVVVGVRSSSECVFDLRHAFIGGDLGFPAAVGRPLCGELRVDGETATVSVFLRVPHALLVLLALLFVPVMALSMRPLLGVPLAAGWILWRVVSLHRSAASVARDAVWAVDLAAHGKSPWQTYA